MQNLVINHNRQAVTTSLQVAEDFGKQHGHVLRDIEVLEKDVSNFGEMFIGSNSDDSYGRPRKIYLMNRDGFTLLAMGFTGKGALQFKLKYIEAFNHMEKSLANNGLPLNYKDALIQLLGQVEENEKLGTVNLMLEQQVKEFKPKATYYDMVLQNKTLLSVSQIAKDYGMGAVTFNKKLNELGIQYKQGGVWLLYAKHQDKGYTQTTTHVIDADKSSILTKWSQGGRLFLYETLKNEGILPMIEREVAT